MSENSKPSEAPKESQKEETKQRVIPYVPKEQRIPLSEGNESDIREI